MKIIFEGVENEILIRSVVNVLKKDVLTCMREDIVTAYLSRISNKDMEMIIRKGVIEYLEKYKIEDILALSK